MRLNGGEVVSGKGDSTWRDDPYIIAYLAAGGRTAGIIPTMSISVGFARLTGNMIEVQVRYGGRPGPWLLDSASGWHVLHRSLHPIELGEALESHVVEVEGVGVEAITLEGEALQLGRFTQHPDQVLAVDFPYIASTGQPIQGLLGYPLFREMPLTIDWDRQVLILDGPPPMEIEHTLPLSIIDRQALIAVTIAGAPLQLRLETGMTQGLLIEQPDFDSERFRTGDDDSSSTVRFEASGMLCDGHPLPAWPAIHSPDPASPCAGRLGLGILSRYTCYIDYPGERLLLSKRAKG